MPDVSRSDSQRSDSSRPRVSFNRDVHVKRISTPGAPKVVGALTGDGEGHLVPLPVRRERPNRLSRRELAKEAERVLAQADKINCTSRSLLEQSQKGNSNKKFSTLPPLRRKNKKNHHNKNNHSAAEQSPTSSPDRNTNRKHSNKRTHYTDNESIERETPPSSLDRKSAKRNFVASVFSTLDRSLSRKNKHLQEDDNSESLKKSKKNSSSLNDLLDESSLEKPRKNRPDLKRSVSDAGSRKNIKNNIKVKKSSGFLSLDRLTSKRNKNKNKSLVIHSDYSDRSPARPRKNILKKSHSDSESVPQGTSQEHSHLHGEGRKKKQLSPIIEVHPREDYFHEKKTSQQLLSSSEKIDVSDREETMIHSSQLPTQKPVLTRGQTVDAMVKRLSKDFSRSRGPPRVVTSAPGLITPEHRQHNNNLPFSYTKPTTNQYGSSAPTAEPTRDSPLNGGPAGNTRAPTASDGQVIYAEVVVSGGGSSGGAVSKQTVHTKVLPISQLQQEEPIQPKLHSRQLDTSKVFPSEASSQQHKVTVKVTDHNHQGSDEDEGLGLMMDHSGYRHNSVDYMDEGKSYNRKGVINSYNGGNSYVSRGGFIEKRIRNGDEERNSFQNTTRREISTDYGGNNIRKEYTVSESKYESDNYIIDPSARGRADGMDSRKKDFTNSESYSGGRYDDVPYLPHMNNISPTLRQNHNGDYSRNESYKSELLSDARIIPPDEIDGPGHFGRSSKDLLSRSIDSNDLSSRRDRLESRIESQRKERFVSNKFSDIGNYKKDPLDTRNEINRKYTTDATYNNRRDFLNSQLDYDKTPTIKEEMRHESDKNLGVKTSRYYESSVTEVDSYGKKDLFADSGIEVDYRTKDSYNSRKYEKPSLHDNKVSVNHHTQNVTRVDLRNHSRDRISDEDEVDVDKDTVNHYSDIGQHHKTKTTNTFTSTRLVQEQKHSETIPSSTVLIRHYVPSNKDDSNSTKTKHTPSSKSKPEKIQQPLLSDEEYEEYEKSRRRDEHKKEATEEYRKNEEKVRRNEEKIRKNGDKKDIKKKPTSAMDKMRQLFTRSDTKSGKKNKRKEDREKVKVIVETVEEEDEEEDPLTARYTEYRGSNIDLRQESPRPPYRDRSHVRGSNMDTEEETPKSVLKNRRLIEPGSPRERRHVHGSSTELDQDVSQKGLTSPKSSHRNRIHHIREVDEGTPRTPHREVSRGVHHRIPSDIDEHKESNAEELHRPVRQRLATPSPSPSPPRAHNRSTSATLTRINNMKNKEHNSNGSGGSWFKSLDRLTKRGKNKAKETDKDTDVTTEDESRTTKQQNNNNSSSNNKNLRFFGDTDQESVSSILRQPNHSNLRRYKSNTNNSSNGTSSNNRLQVPSRNMGGGGPRHHRSAGDVATSSAESTTEGDSSQQSQRSVVYLHAATVGDIPGPARSQHSGVARRAQSREELSSTRPLQPQTRTVSRSISVLAPWKPRHYRDGIEVHYDNNESSSKTLGRNKDGKPPKVPVSHHSGNSTMNRSGGSGNRYKSNGDRGKENHSIQKQRVNKAMSVESLSRKNGSGQGQYNRDRTPSEKKHSGLNSSASVESLNQKQSRDRSSNSKKYSALNSSAMELNSNKSYRTATKKGSEGSTKKSSAKVSRSASMPKDSRLTAGWFKLRNKKQGT